MTGARDSILVVDDVAANIHVLYEGLGDEYDVAFATSGEEALELAQRLAPALILLDVMMPVCDGYETCRRLKADATTSQIPVIFVTSRGDEGDELTGFACGAVDYLVKPMNMITAKARIRTHLELKRVRDLLDSQARMDSLTGLANRRAFDEALDREWRRALRSHRPIGVAIADVDEFKRYNDNYGHPAGDACLRSVAGALADCMGRPGDLVGRYGGEEFSYVISEADLGAACAIAEKTRNRVLTLRIEHSASPYRIVSISVGVAACVPEATGGWANLLQAADQQLYAAKKAGRNRVMPTPM
jgi:diguanylate cyclase (GGDEF)-like protein